MGLGVALAGVIIVYMIWLSSSTASFFLAVVLMAMCLASSAVQQFCIVLFFFPARKQHKSMDIWWPTNVLAWVIGRFCSSEYQIHSHLLSLGAWILCRCLQLFGPVWTTYRTRLESLKDIRAPWNKRTRFKPSKPLSKQNGKKAKPKKCITCL